MIASAPCSTARFGVLFGDYPFDQEPALYLGSKSVEKRRAQIGRCQCRHSRDIQACEHWAATPHIVGVVYVAIRTMPAVGEHRTLQSLVVARAAGVRGENDIRAAGIPCMPNDAGRYGPIVGGVELLPEGSTARGHHGLDRQWKFPWRASSASTGWLLRRRPRFRPQDERRA